MTWVKLNVCFLDGQSSKCTSVGTCRGKSLWCFLHMKGFKREAFWQTANGLLVWLSDGHFACYLDCKTRWTNVRRALVSHEQTSALKERVALLISLQVPPPFESSIFVSVLESCPSLYIIVYFETCTQFCLCLMFCSLFIFFLPLIPFHTSINSALYVTHESSQYVSIRGLHKKILLKGSAQSCRVLAWVLLC